MELKRNFKVLDPEKLRKEPNIFIQCTHCGKYIELPITQSQIDDWHKKNTFIQDEFPELTPVIDTETSSLPKR